MASRKANYYVNPKELTEELTALAKSYRAERDAMIKEKKSGQEFKERVSELIVQYTEIKLRKKDLRDMIRPKKDANGEVAKSKRGPSEQYKESIADIIRTMGSTVPSKTELRAISKVVALEELTVACGKKATGECSEELGLMFLKIVDGVGNKKNWINYTYKIEMKGLGIEFLCKYAKKYDFTHPRANAFSYLTQICNNGFKQVQSKEKKQSEIKDKLIKQSMESSEQDRWLRANDSRYSPERD